MQRTALVALVAALVAGATGYLAGARGSGGARSAPAAPGERTPDDELELAGEPAALQVCEERLASAEAALARRPARADAPAIEVAALPADTREVVGRPDVSRAIELEVERRLEERFQRERARRQAEWAARRAELRERMHAIGIDDATLAEVTPAMCAIRDAYRQAWRARREGLRGDAGVPMGRRAVRQATRPLREEIAATLGPERMARLEEEGGMRSLGGAVECEGESATR